MTKAMTKTAKRTAAGRGITTAKSVSRRAGRSQSLNGVDARIIELADWRGEALAKVRLLIRKVDPAVVEEVKWRKPSNGMAGVPVWSRDGIICTGETYRNVVKLTFAKGAALPDPAGLFNAGLEGGTRRAIDIHEEDTIDDRAFQALIRAAIAANTGKANAKSAGKPVRGLGDRASESNTAAQKKRGVVKKASPSRGR